MRVLKNINKRNAYNFPIERLRREPEILAELVIFFIDSAKMYNINQFFQDHPHVLRGLGYYEAVDHIVMVSDYCRGKTLKELLKTKTFTEDEVAAVMKQIISGLSYLHANGVIHRGIQPNNILFEHENDIFSLKICGFLNAARANSAEDINEEVKLVSSF